MNSMVKWVIGTMFGACVAAVTVMTFVLNNATPRAGILPQAPLLIQLSSSALPTPPVTP
jgi:hypothetical protein